MEDIGEVKPLELERVVQECVEKLSRHTSSVRIFVTAPGVSISLGEGDLQKQCECILAWADLHEAQYDTKAKAQFPPRAEGVPPIGSPQAGQTNPPAPQIAESSNQHIGGWPHMMGLD